LADVTEPRGAQQAKIDEGLITMMVKLGSGQGADECNYAGQRYRVDNDGTVLVDKEAVGPLLAIGGFVLADPPVVQVPHGSVRVMHKSDPAATASVAGVRYAPDGEPAGGFEVPIAAVADLAAHGFTIEPRRRLPPVG